MIWEDKHTGYAEEKPFGSQMTRMSDGTIWALHSFINQTYSWFLKSFFGLQSLFHFVGRLLFLILSVLPLFKYYLLLPHNLYSKEAV